MEYEPPQPSHLAKQGACPASSTVSHRQVIITTPVFSPARAGAFCFPFPGEDSLNYSTGRTRQLAGHPDGLLPHKRAAQSKHSPQATISPLTRFYRVKHADSGSLPGLTFSMIK